MALNLLHTWIATAEPTNGENEESCTIDHNIDSELHIIDGPLQTKKGNIMRR